MLLKEMWEWRVGLFIFAVSVKLEKTAGRRRGPEKMRMAALRLPCRPCVLSASPRLTLDIFQARLARRAWAGALGHGIFRWLAWGGGLNLFCRMATFVAKPTLDLWPIAIIGRLSPQADGRQSLN